MKPIKILFSLLVFIAMCLVSSTSTYACNHECQFKVPEVQLQTFTNDVLSIDIEQTTKFVIIYHFKIEFVGIGNTLYKEPMKTDFGNNSNYANYNYNKFEKLIFSYIKCPVNDMKLNNKNYLKNLENLKGLSCGGTGDTSNTKNLLTT